MTNEVITIDQRNHSRNSVLNVVGKIEEELNAKSHIIIRRDANIIADCAAGKNARDIPALADLGDVEICNKIVISSFGAFVFAKEGK